ncbi:MAG: MFS transporter [Gammaproteobacteria bacterium]|nr:MAG: MFS transporter [Gammaproteobacteria bacterium]UTW43486.1 MFS transporter [bacterium SCSIO 12844]
MTALEKKSIFSLASIYSFRMLGLFMILPIFTLYAHQIKDATALLIGVALGVYGLTQALLQIVFGMSSDKLGRKPVIIFGLLLFIIGSIIAAESQTIYGIILGRAIQGAGAIGSTLTAMVADTTQEENRMKAMSIIGMTIGLSFIGAMMLSPILSSFIGLSGIFWLTAFLGFIGIIIILTITPTSKEHLLHRDCGTVSNQLLKVITTPELIRLNYGIFTLHAILTALFIIIPVILTSTINLKPDLQWIIYLPVLILSFALMLPFIIIAETKRKMKPIFLGAIILLTLTQVLLLGFHHNIISISFILLLFFATFTFLEASLPSLVSKIAPAGNKGTAMGIYSSLQFLGIFVGGVFGGIIYHVFGINGIFIFCALLSALWIPVAASMKKPKHLSSKVIPLLKITSGIQDKLASLKGVSDVMVCPDEMVAYLKIDKLLFDEHELKSLIN